MSNNICFPVFILACITLTFVNSRGDRREYAIHRDIFDGFKAWEYTVYDKSEKHVRYRIESDYGLTQNIKVIVHPSKREVGRLQAKITLFFYKAEISTFNPNTNQWHDGSIEENFTFVGRSFSINWHGSRIKGRKTPFSSTTNFYNEYGQLIAKVRRRIFTLFKKEYDMKIYSNKYPDQVFLLGFAAYDRFSAPKQQKKKNE